MNKAFLRSSKNKYLRKKSHLLVDYLMGGCFLVLVVALVDSYNRKINPEELEDDDGIESSECILFRSPSPPPPTTPYFLGF